jgi:hypothetical protein
VPVFLVPVSLGLVVFEWVAAHSLCFLVGLIAEGAVRSCMESCRAKGADAIGIEEEEEREREREGGRAAGTEPSADARRC